MYPIWLCKSVCTNPVAGFLSHLGFTVLVLKISEGNQFYPSHHQQTIPWLSLQVFIEPLYSGAWMGTEILSRRGKVTSWPLSVMVGKKINK